MPSNLSLIKLDIGTFKGFGESGLEFSAEIVSPYHTEYRPKIGEFMVVTTSHESAVLGRVTRFHPVGVLSSGEGEEYLAEMRRRSREIPEDLKETKLRYTVNVKLLGGLEIKAGEFIYRPSVRQLPHLGARVGTLSEEALRYVCALGKGTSHSVSIGHYTIGETVYDGTNGQAELPVLFDLDHLVARRTFVFARAGYGKSNLIKLLSARLYELKQPGGMVVFDPEGEYAFRNKVGSPGFADVPHLAEKLVVYTNRNIKNSYARWVAGDVKINLAHLRPSDVVNQCVAEGKQEAVFANLLRGLESSEWEQLIELLAEKGYRADENQIAQITGYGQEKNSVVIGAIKNNLTPVVNALHSNGSDLISALRGHLAEGRIVVIDISLLSSTNGYRIAGLAMNELFRRNQENFVADSDGKVVPIIAVLEEAQSILPKGVSDSSPFVAWVKEGRKYQLGAILITQQPGSIAPELLSQGDNFFAFHLLSLGDLKSLQGHNAHYSDDVLANVLNEPIRGNAYIWSAPDQPFVLPARIHNYDNWAKSLSGEEAEALDGRETPVEVRKRVQPTLQDKFDELVLSIIKDKPSVVIYGVAQANSSHVAINLWNLLFSIGEAIGGDEQLFSEYGRRLDDGKPIVDENTCRKSLTRLGLFVRIGTAENGKKHFVIEGSTIQRVRKSEVVNC